MNENIIGIIIILVLVLILAGGAWYAYIQIRDKIRMLSEILFGTTSFLKGIQKREREVAVTPKSVSSATDMYLSEIMRDFPEFHYDEMKTRAENVLTSYLRCIDGMSSKSLSEGTRELREALDMRIKSLKSMGHKEHFQNINIHKTEIHQYRKTKGRISIIFQSAVEYVHFVEAKGAILKGRVDMLEQSRYNIELIYIQDQDFVEDVYETALGLHCPNCGAPISSLGENKVCKYCDSPIVEFNMRTWNFSKVKEMK